MILGNISIAVLVFLLSYWLTKHLTRPAFRLRFLDHPNERSLHAQPTPRTGGLAILASLGVGLLIERLSGLVWDTTDQSITKDGLWVLGLSLLIAAVSFLDDWAKLPSGLRLIAHLLAACGVILGAGSLLDKVNVPFVGDLKLSWLALPVTMLWLVWMINLYNFMDGMDGFAGGMSVCGFSFLCYLGYAGGHSTLAIIALLVAAASAGFLWHNFPAANIFMGDVGSTVLGFLAGALSVIGVYNGVFDLFVPVLIFAPFIIDATMTLLRRLLRGEKVWLPHRKHLYQRLVLAGWSHRKTVWVEYILMLVGGASAVVYNKLRNEQLRLLVLFAYASAFMIFIFVVRMVERKNNGVEIQRAG